ncbi:HTH DNA-binding protein [Mycobacterium phage Weirdo19]|uniref:HTH DNA-binding protein n=1 Tax=Mycobacterium phage Weirdo19 TaxID=2601610 RepID=A0A6M2YSU9_9CAUD|nr:HTH DNA-binding protein [Mycobacterium phage Weirdo19]QEA10816.1 HTH DNA-binding protein [Mycobacterium phage Weirdo19]
MFATQDNNRSPQRVPAAPVRGHVAELIAAGLPPSEIARLAGVETRRVLTLINPDRTERGTARTGDPSRHMMSSRIAAALLALPIPESMFVDAVGPVRRLRALVRIGYPFDILANVLGYTEDLLRELAFGDPIVIDTELAGLLADLFDRWHMTPGPSDEARELGRRNRFAAPLAWAIDDDDTAGMIDDPAAEPDGLPLHTDPRWRKVGDDFPDIVADHRALGRFDEEIAAILGLSLNTFAKRLHNRRIPERRRGDGRTNVVRPPLYGARYSLRLPARMGAAS